MINISFVFIIYDFKLVCTFQVCLYPVLLNICPKYQCNIGFLVNDCVANSTKSAETNNKYSPLKQTSATTIIFLHLIKVHKELRVC